MRLLLNVRFSEGTFEVFGTSPAFSTPHENREFTEERAGGSEFSILRGCLLEHLGRFRLLFPFLARIENLRRRGQAVQNSRFSGIVSSIALWTLLPARIGDSWIGTRAYTRVFPVRRGVSLLNQGFGVGLTNAIALIINCLGVHFGICFTKQERVKK